MISLVSSSTALLDCALLLADQGFHVIPLGGARERPPQYVIDRERAPEIAFDVALRIATAKWSKMPRIAWKAYQSEAADAEQIEHWWSTWPNANVGIVTGVNLVVVDADNQLAIDWIEKKHLTFSPWRVITGKGKHYYYQVNPDLEIRNSTDASARIDIRGVGGYVVAAGSLHHSLARYTDERVPGFDTDQVSDLPMLSSDDLAAIRGFNGTTTTTPAAHNAQPVLMDLRQYSVAASFAPVDPGTRNTTAASLAGQLVRGGDSVAETLGKLTAWNNACPEPLPDGELASVAASVANTHARNTGEIVPIAPPPPPDPVTVALDAETIAYPMGHLLDNPPAPVEQFWGTDLLYRRARVMIAGKPKIGKSRFALALAMQAAVGGRFLGRDFHATYKVLWLQAEIPRPYLHRRLMSSARALDGQALALARQNLIVTERAAWDLSEEFDQMKLRLMLERHQVDMLMIDPLRECAAIDENDAKEVSKLLKFIGELEQEFNIATVIVHHIKKITKGAATFDDVRGSSVFAGWADTGILLDGTAEKTQLSYLARETSAASHLVCWNTALGSYSVELADSVAVVREEDSVAGQEHVEPLVAELVSLIQAARDGMSIGHSELISRLKERAPTLAAHQGALERAIVRLGDLPDIAVLGGSDERHYGPRR